METSGNERLMVDDENEFEDLEQESESFNELDLNNFDREEGHIYESIADEISELEITTLEDLDDEFLDYLEDSKGG